MDTIGVKVSNRDGVCVGTLQISLQVAIQTVSGCLEKRIGNRTSFGEKVLWEEKRRLCANSRDQSKCRVQPRRRRSPARRKGREAWRRRWWLRRKERQGIPKTRLMEQRCKWIQVLKEQVETATNYPLQPKRGAEIRRAGEFMPPLYCRRSGRSLF